jgi:hypothetical protein
VEVYAMPHNEKRDRCIDAEEAARIIYNTREPDPRQVGQVRAMILRGVIHGSEDGRWTTVTAVAEFLAAVTLRQRSAGRDDRRTAAARAGDAPQRSSREREYRSAYRESLKEYFLAVIYRRDRRQFSKPFQRAVIVGQIGLLALIMTVLVAILVGLRPQREPPELTVVRAWIKKDAKSYEIIRWYPPHPSTGGDGTSIRVIYEYSDTGRKTIHTDRVFVISENQVTAVSSTE